MVDSASTRSSDDSLHDHIQYCQRLVGSDIQFAFQTILDATEQEVIGFEALVRGIKSEPAALVMSRIGHDDRFAFDQACRIRAIEAATEFDIDVDLHLNCTDVKAANVHRVIEVIEHYARRYKLDLDRIVLEMKNLHAIDSRSDLTTVREAIREAGMYTLADNFGQRDADLGPPARFRPDLLKLDHHLVENIHQRPAAQAIVRGALAMCRDLEIRVIAAGVENNEEFHWLQAAGVELFQGYFFAQPDTAEPY